MNVLKTTIDHVIQIDIKYIEVQYLPIKLYNLDINFKFKFKEFEIFL